MYYIKMEQHYIIDGYWGSWLFFDEACEILFGR